MSVTTRRRDRESRVAGEVHRRRGARRRAEGRRRRDDNGYVMALTALLLVPLLLFTAFAVDLGSWYGQAAKMQRTADAAALAGVIYADDTVTNQWNTIARGVAQRNGYVDGVNGVTVDVQRLDDRKLRVSIGKNGSQFFTKLVLGSVPMNRKATAEFVLPIPLGSPLNTFGNQTLTATAPNFWAAISGPYTARANGDLHATKCINSTSETACSSTNPEYRASGYLYAIQVPSGVSGLKLDLFDAGYYSRGATVETGDRDYGDGSYGVATRYELYDQDGTPLIPDDNPAASCATGANGLTILPGANAATYKNAWVNMCTKTGIITPGIYYLRVKSSGVPGVSPDKGNATNQFALRVTNGVGAAPTGLRLYAVNDMSIRSIQASGNTDFYLAEVPAVHAGKKLKVSLFDPGDASGNVTMTIQPPGGGSIACTYTVDGSGGGSLSPGCALQTTTNGTATYSGKNVEFTINLPSTYNCNPANSTDCWWKIRANYSAQASDRTVWSATIVGDPVHLIE